MAGFAPTLTLAGTRLGGEATLPLAVAIGVLGRPGPRAAPRGSRGHGVDDRNVSWILPRIERIYL